MVAWRILLPWTERQIGAEPFLWVLGLLFTGWRKLTLCAVWTAAILFAVLLFNRLDATSDNVARTKAQLYLRRKFFHLLAVLMFAPGALLEPQFMHLAFSVAVCAFIIVEYLRSLRVPPFGDTLHAFLTRFLDHRDAGPVILSHIYLLLGCAIPIWLQVGQPAGGAGLAALAGVITLGFGDAMASTVGIRFGQRRWPGTSKTVEGTLAFVICVQLSPWLLGLSIPNQTTMLFVAVLAGALECVSDQNDNLLLPPVTYATMRLVGL
ncbi:hypothetical protein THASP1DRAFT_16191 [Thamnocephalis sphaerospora]|uniref:dolichol kinase n=1 Tax=Thamnocephalis sphaerospora TaxID=78915 RepID=A0A4P9XPW6_9FUNG|nr:hypothetical protein THASP1DRAFT_16191 [Thamnocephalis sphaerospora]|eukprot:RKP08048.1 hypothetical protein THASP1DRAFT_16191 [Thamnocephalis sphaerospora]